MVSLTPRARRAWDAWSKVGGQITVINPNASKAEDVRVKLDTDAILAGMRMTQTPDSDESWAWDRILMLHDIACHDGRNVLHSICGDHGMGGDVEVDPDCERCMECFGLERADG